MLRLSLFGFACAAVVWGCGEAPEVEDAPEPSRPLTVLPDTTSEAPVFRVREWTLDDGLPAQVESVAQTPDGLLWLATHEGLARFDGVQFEVFNAENTPAIVGDEVFVSVYAAQGGDLWAGTKSRTAYRLRDGEWSAFSLDDLFGQHWIGGFAEDGEGTLWAVSTGPLLARFDGETWTLFSDRLDSVWPLFVADAEGRLWSELSSDAAPGPPTAIGGSGVVARLEGDRFEPVGDAWLAGFSPTQYGPLLHRLRRSPSGLDGRVRMDLTDADGRLLTWIWFDDRTRRAMLVDRAGRAWVQLQDGLSQNTLVVVKDGVEHARFAPESATWFEQVFEDRQGGIWTFASTTGLLQIIEEPFRRYGTDDGVPRYAVRTTVGTQGETIVSTTSTPDELRVATIASGEVATGTYRLAGPASDALTERLPDGRVSPGQVVEDASGRRWGVSGGSVLRLDDGQAEEVVRVGRVLLRATAPDPSAPDILWVGDYRAGVYRVDTRAGVVTDSLVFGGTRPAGNAVTYAFSFHQAEDGSFWVAAEGGLAEVLPDKTLRPVAALEGHSVRALADADDGGLWAATYGGLARVRDGDVRILGREGGLPDPDLTTVLADEHGYLWATARGRHLYRFRAADVDAVLDGRRDRVDVVTLLPSDGHLGSAQRIWGAVRDPEGDLWVPSDRGVTRIDPALYARQHAQPPTVVLGGVTTEAGETHAFQEGLTLPLGERTLTLSYTATDLLRPDHVRFRTFLEGHGEGWVDRENDRRAVFGGLRPGHYTLWVQAMNAGGIWSEPVASPPFRVPALLWETVWFRVLAALATLGLLGLVMASRERSRRRRERRLEAEVADRTEALRVEKQKTEAQAEQLRELDRAKSRFFANVSHEFRTPLTLTIGPLEDLRDGAYGPLGDEARPPVGLAIRSARRVLDLINQILDVAKLDAHRVRLQARRLDLDAFVGEVADAFTPLADRLDIDLSVRRPGGPVWVWADREALDKVVSNLLSNAFKFTPEGGRVRLALSVAPRTSDDAEATAGTAVLAVTDTGPGIADEHLPHLFDRFYQADSTATPSQPGTGIGLTLVKELTELHGGTVAVASAPGEGTTFTVRLALGRDHLAPDHLAPDHPAPEGSEPTGAEPDATAWAFLPDSGADPEATAAPVVEADDGEDRPTLLIADDHAGIRAYVRRHFERDYRIVEAADGAAALALARERLPDLVISDVMMPELDGVALCRTLKDDPATDFIPVVLLTAKAGEEATLAGLGASADDYVTKPFNVRELAARVGNLIRQRKRLRERFGEVGGDGAVASAVPPGLSAADEALVRSVREAIEAGLSDETFGVDEIVQAVGVSRSSLYRRVGDALGETPVALLKAARLARAARLLTERAGNVSEVAYAVGFKSVTHFSKSFHAAYGVPPSAYADAPEPAGPAEGGR